MLPLVPLDDLDPPNFNCRQIKWSDVLEGGWRLRGGKVRTEDILHLLLDDSDRAAANRAAFGPARFA